MELRRNIARSCVKNKRDTVGMLRRVTQKYTDLRTVRPLVVQFLSLQRGLQNINRRPKWTKMLQIGFNLCIRQVRDNILVILIRKLSLSIFSAWNESGGKGIAQIYVVLEGRLLKSRSDS